MVKTQKSIFISLLVLIVAGVVIVGIALKDKPPQKNEKFNRAIQETKIRAETVVIDEVDQQQSSESKKFKLESLEDFKKLVNLPPEEQEAIREELLQSLSAEKYNQFIQQMDDYKESNRQNGYFSEEDEQSYADYDTKTLEAMGDQGDLLALSVLTNRYLGEEQNLEKARANNFKMLYNGASKGATFAANSGFQVTPEEVASGKLNGDVYMSLALYQVAIDMGDRYAESARNSKLKLNSIELTPQQQSIVEDVARQLREKISATRNRMGISSAE